MDNKPVLSILICSVNSRRELLLRLLRELRAQIMAQIDPSTVEIIFKVDDGSLPVGEKRNRLMAEATGQYLCFVDDDDRVMMDYVTLILEALATGPDVVGLCGIYTSDNRAPILFRESVEYKFDCNSRSAQGVEFHERLINHLCPTRTELARAYPFPALNCFEDSTRARAMVGAFKTQVMIERPIYLYDFRPAQSLTQGPNAKRGKA